MGIITKDWIDANDAVIQEKLLPLSDAKIIKTLPCEPYSWEALLSYKEGNTNHLYKIGDEVRVPDNLSESGYSYYKLIDASNNNALWKKLGNVKESITGTIVVTLEAYSNNIKNTGEDLVGTVVSLTDSVNSETIVRTLEQGQSTVTFSNLTLDRDYEVSVSAVANYTHPASQIISALNYVTSAACTFKYNCSEYIVKITSNQENDAVIAAIEGTVTYGNISQNTRTSVKVPFGTSANVTFPDVANYKKTVGNSGRTYFANYETETVTVNLYTETDEDISEAAFTIKDYENNILGTGSSGDSIKIPYDTVYKVEVSDFESLMWDTYDQTASQPSKTINVEYEVESDFVDLGLPSGNLWAKQNLGASNPEDIGLYYSWGNTEGHEDGYNFSSSNYTGTAGDTFIKSKETATGSVLPVDTTNDAARSVLGGFAAIPDKDECAEIHRYCTYTVTYKNSIRGFKITGPNGKSIFFPETGYYSGTTIYDTSQFQCLTASYAYKYSITHTSIFGRITQGVSYNGISSSTRWYGYVVRAIQRPRQEVYITTYLKNKYFKVIDRESTQLIQSLNNTTGQLTATVVLGTVDFRCERYNLNTTQLNIIAGTTQYSLGGGTYINDGVYAYYSDGTMKSYDNADTNAIGVAVLTSATRFVIDKYNAPSSQRSDGMFYVPYPYADYDDINIGRVDTWEEARLDYAGASKSGILINYFKNKANYYYDYSGDSAVRVDYTGAPGLEACRKRFNGSGYMGALGQWYQALLNKTAVDNMMSKIGGTSLTYGNGGGYVTVTIYTTPSTGRTPVGCMEWGGGYTTTCSGSDSTSYCRAFGPIF